MIIKLIRPFFGPGMQVRDKSGRIITGQYLEAGIYQNWPKDQPYPKSAIRLDHLPPKAEIEERAISIQEFVRGAGMEEVKDPSTGEWKTSIPGQKITKPPDIKEPPQGARKADVEDDFDYDSGEDDGRAKATDLSQSGFVSATTKK